MSTTSGNQRPVGVGVIGTGFGRTTQIPAFRATPGVEVVAVASGSLARAYEAAKQHGIRRAFDAEDLDRLLALDDLDLVCVSSPPDTHRDYSLRALAAGKHVLCEKPTALDADQARVMVEAARRSDRLALLDHELRFDPARRRLRELVADGYLGRLFHVRLDVESEFRLDTLRPWSWWSDAERGGGILGAIGSHAVDTLRYLFGEPHRGRAVLRTWIGERPEPGGKHRRPVTADDYAAFWLELDGGALVACTLSAMSRAACPGWTLAAHGSDGTLVLDAAGSLLGQRHGEGRFEVLPLPEPVDVKALEMPDNLWSRAFLHFARELAAAVAEGRREVPDAATFEDGLRAQQVLDALRASAARGQWMECGPGAAVTA